MKGLLRRLTPFAPDQSGAAAALYELGGILVICDAGGCAGNVCGFDEPRWFQSRSAIFSAGLRDMDAILGRDDKLIGKLQSAAEEIGAAFAAVIGTPVPAVIGTDFRALRRMGENRLGIPVLSIPATGVRLYDEGAAEAYVQLFQTFAKEKLPPDAGVAGVLGATPLDMGRTDPGAGIDEALRAEGAGRALVYGMGAGLDEVKRASRARENIVVSPAGLPAAKYLEETFGTPWRAACPIPAALEARLGELSGRRTLVVHQQVLANAVRGRALSMGAASVDAATWFTLAPELAQPGDVRLNTEEELSQLLTAGHYDAVVADSALRPAAGEYDGLWLDAPHFAVSGRLMEP
jgi:hypothetical protein